MSAAVDELNTAIKQHKAFFKSKKNSWRDVARQHITLEELASMKIPEAKAAALARALLDEIVRTKVPDPSTTGKTAPAPDRFKPVPVSQFRTISARTEWLIEGDVLPKGPKLAIAYGQSGIGKSFFVLHMSLAIVLGTQWFGHKAQQGRVLYICGEGASGVPSRLAAYEARNNIDLNRLDDRLLFLRQSPSLLEEREVDELLGQLEELGNFDLVIMDTWARAIAGGNESSSEDVGYALKQIERIQVATGATVLLVAHSGKNELLGVRGWSGLRAAADTEIEIARAGSGQRAHISKQRDGEDGQRFGFKLALQQFAAGTSRVVEPTADPAGNKREPTGGVQKIILKTLREMLECPEYVGGVPRKTLNAAVAEKCGTRPDSANRSLNELIANENVFVVGDKASLTPSVAASEEFDAVPEEPKSAMSSQPVNGPDPDTSWMNAHLQETAADTKRHGGTHLATGWRQ